MDIKEFSKLIRAKQKEIDTLMRRKMPIRVGNMAKRHFQDNFRKSGFVDGGLHPWPKTKRQLSGGTSAASQHRPLLSNQMCIRDRFSYFHSAVHLRLSAK